MPLQIIRGDVQEIGYCEALFEFYFDPQCDKDAVDHSQNGSSSCDEKKEIGDKSDELQSEIWKKGVCNQAYLAYSIACEEKILDADNIRELYEIALKDARDCGFHSVAFPLVGCREECSIKDQVFLIVAETISAFLDENTDMLIILVVPYGQVFCPYAPQLSGLSEIVLEAQMKESLRQEQKWQAIHMCSTESFPAIGEDDEEAEKQKCKEELQYDPYGEEAFFPEGRVYYYQNHGIKWSRRPKPDYPTVGSDIEYPFNLLQTAMKNKFLDESFSQMMLRKIDEEGFKKDSDFYKKANLTKQTFSKMKTPNYHPKKTTAAAVVLALELSLDEAKEMLGKAGYTLSHSMLFDIIIEYCLEIKYYNVYVINGFLFNCDMPLLGG